MKADNDLDTLLAFLPCRTPEAWLVEATRQPDVLLVDHANCEKKAAATALNLMFRYVRYPDLQLKLSQLAREELLHYEQVLSLMQERQIPYLSLSAARYARELHQLVRKQDPEQLTDLLIVGALIEARSCERFLALIPYVDTALARYYRYLLNSESRHFEDYLALARLYAREDIEPRVMLMRAREKELIETLDTDFRFHSGVPMSAAPA